MNFFKLFVFATLLFFGSSAHRFQRYVLNNGTNLRNAIVEELAAADGSIVQQIGGDLNLVGNGQTNIQLDNGNALMFELCSSFSSNNCLGINISVCYDALYPVPSLRGRCGSGQCQFNATVSQYGDFYKIVIDDKLVRMFKNEKVCAQATMKFPRAIVPSLPDIFDSCNPKIYDGNMVNVSVTGASSNCYLTVKHAKQWFPSTTPLSTTLSIVPPVPTTTEAALSAGTTAAIAIGCVFGVIALIAIIVIIICCYRDHKKKNSIPRTIEGLPVETALEKAFAKEDVGDKAGLKKETTPKPDGKEKKEAAAAPVEKERKAKERSKPSKAKKAAVQEKKPIVVKEEPEPPKQQVEDEKTKDSKEPVEDPGKKVSIEPTLEDPKLGNTLWTFMDVMQHFNC